MNGFKLNTIEEALEDFREGKFLIVVDDEDRENEGDFIIAAVLLWYAKKNPSKGKISAMYLMLYSVGRFLVEFTRNDDRGSVGELSTSQFIGMITLVAAAFCYFVLIPKRDKKQQCEQPKEAV